MMDLVFLDRARYLTDVENSTNMLQYIIRALYAVSEPYRSCCTGSKAGVLLRITSVEKPHSENLLPQ